MNAPIRIVVGYDRRTPIIYYVLTHSITRRASQPVSFTPLSLDTLERSATMTRDVVENQSTEFAFSRFLAPYLVNYEGWVIFMDNDVVVLDDIVKLWELRDDRYAVMCVKHEHNPNISVKFLGEKQTVYPKKNWSSVMLMNAARCKALTPEYVNSASGLDLHRFNWLESEDEIGALPPEWNNLVGISGGKLEDQKLLHYTDGGPYFKDYQDCHWADVWTEERDHLLTTREVKLYARAATGSK